MQQHHLGVCGYSHTYFCGTHKSLWLSTGCQPWCIARRQWSYAMRRLQRVLSYYFEVQRAKLTVPSTTQATLTGDSWEMYVRSEQYLLQHSPVDICRLCQGVVVAHVLTTLQTGAKQRRVSPMSHPLRGVVGVVGVEETGKCVRVSTFCLYLSGSMWILASRGNLRNVLDIQGG